MRKLLLFFTYLICFTAFAFCQTKTKSTLKQNLSELTKLLSGSGLPYKMMNDSVAIIPYEGENIASVVGMRGRQVAERTNKRFCHGWVFASRN